MSKGGSHFLKLGGGMLVRIEVNRDCFLEVFVDVGHRDCTITILNSIPKDLGGIAGNCLLDRGRETKGKVTPSHLIILVPKSKIGGSDWGWSSTNNRYSNSTFNITHSPCNMKKAVITLDQMLQLECYVPDCSI